MRSGYRGRNPSMPPLYAGFVVACVGWASVPSTGSGQAFCLPTIGEDAGFVPRGQTVKLSAHPTGLKLKADDNKITFYNNGIGISWALRLFKFNGIVYSVRQKNGPAASPNATEPCVFHVRRPLYSLPNMGGRLD